MDWIYKLQDAVNYIEDNLLEDIHPEDISKSIYSSSFHFQRIFSLITGVSVGEYIRNRRLSLAGLELYQTKAKTIDMALKYGYETPESFAKAFTRFHGISPSTARNSDENLKSFNRLQIQINVKGKDILDYKIEIKDEFIGSKSKILPEIKIRFNNTWVDTAFSDFMNSLVAALYYTDKKYTTEYVMGATGAAFNAYWSFVSNNSCDLLLLGDKFIEKTFHNLRFYYTHFKKETCANWESVIKSKIVESIDNDFPALVRFKNGYSVVCGYDNNGSILHGTMWCHDDANGYFNAEDWYENVDNVIIINGKKPEQDLAEQCKDILEWCIHLLRLPSFYNYENNIECFNGIACYDKVIAFLKDEEKYNGQYDIRYWCEEIFNNFIQFNINKRKFIPGFLRSIARDFTSLSTDLEEASKAFSIVAELYNEIGKEAPYSWLPDDKIEKIKDTTYRNCITSSLLTIKESEIIGVQFLEHALEKLISGMSDSCASVNAR